MFKYDELKKKYSNFGMPVAVIRVNGKDIIKDKAKFAISDIFVELTSGFEASVAEFKIYNAYSPVANAFAFDVVKKYIFLGSPVQILMGYGDHVREVFRGFISQVNFIYPRGASPAVEVHAMDIKGIMMANDYAKQISAKAYSDAVKQVLEQGFYQRLMGSDAVYQNVSITDTPDKQPGGEGDVTDQTIEMVNESDYEFVVRAAKRFNYEFFQIGDTVYFRKAKSDTQDLITIGPDSGLIAFDVGYDITGLAGSIEVRNTDPGKGKMVMGKKKLTSKMSEGSKAKQLVARQKKVYIDPTAATQKDAEYRAEYLLEKMSYRLGTMEVDMLGLPEIIPGKFIVLSGLGKAASNRFYISSVRHSMDSDGLYETHISGRSATL